VRLLLIELHHLGDALLSLPFVRAATRAGHEIEVLCRPDAAPVLQLLLPPAHIRTWNPPWSEGTPDPSVANPRAIAASLRGYDAAVCAWADVRVHLLMARAGIPRRIGFPANTRNFYAPKPAWRRRRLRLGQLAQALLPLALGRPLLTERLTRSDSQPAQLGKWEQLASHLSLPWDASAPWFEIPAEPIPPTEESARATATRFAARARAEGRRILAVHPGGRLPSKRWPVERFESLLGRPLTDPAPALLVIDPPDSRGISDLPETALRIATRSIPELAAVLAQCDAALCNDSMTAHLAAALGLPVVSIFGSGDPAWFAPHGSEHLVVATSACPHRPCVDRCVMPSYVCVDSVTELAVVEKVRAALEAAPRSH